MSSLEVFPKESFQKIKKIAAGTYGILYEGKHHPSGTPVAIKRFKVDGNIDFIGCIKELDFLARLKDHPFIVNLLGVTRGSPFGASKFNGIADILDKDSPFRGEDSIFSEDKLYFILEKATYDGTQLKGISISYLKMIMLQSLLGLEYMHGHGVLHRDIKPSNLLWFRDNINRTVKFCDFGISKMFTRQETNSYAVMTPIYRAPELFFKMNDYDYSSDVWSLGCTFYELLKGESFVSHQSYKGADGDRKVVKEILSKIPEIPSEYFIQKACRSMGYRIPRQFLGPRSNDWNNLFSLSQNKVKEFNEGSVFGTYDNFKKLLSGMMKIDPAVRLTASQALNHDFFKDYSSEIAMVREKWKPYDEEYFNPKIRIHDCEERKWVTSIISYFYNKQNEIDPATSKRRFDWFQIRILFHTLSLYDRFLQFYFEYGMDQTQKQTEESAGFCFIVCLYISIKYFLTLLEPCQFHKLINEKYRNLDGMKKAEDFEWFMLYYVLKFKVYQPTLYEAADYFGIILNPQQTINLLSLYGSLGDEKCTLSELFVKLAPSSGITLKNYITTKAAPIVPVEPVEPLEPAEPVMVMGGVPLTPSPIRNASETPTPTPHAQAIGEMLDKVIQRYVPTSGAKNGSDGGMLTSIKMHNVDIGLQTAHGKITDLSQAFNNLKIGSIK